MSDAIDPRLAGLSPEDAAKVAAILASVETKLDDLNARNEELAAQLRAAGGEPDPVLAELKELHPRAVMACSRLPGIHGPALLPNGWPGNRPGHPDGPGLYIWLRGYRLGSYAFRPTRSATRGRGKGLADTGKPESAGNPPNRL